MNDQDRDLLIRGERVAGPIFRAERTAVRHTFGLDWHDTRTVPGETVSEATARIAALPADSAPRKQLPIATGVVDYFPAAMVAIAELSRKGNDQHNPGQPLHWSRGKSDDHPDALMRHFIERGKMDVDGIRHSAKVAWRALAILQLELEVAAKTAEERTWRLGDPVRARAWPDIPEEAVGLPCDVERHE